MKIYTLGTSHGDSTFCRFNSSTANETDNGTVYLVDAGAPCEALLRRKGLNVKNLRATFVTDMHDDHSGGLSSLIKQITKYKSERSIQFSLFLPEERAISALKNWIIALHEPAEADFIVYGTVDDGVIYSDDELAVTAIRTAHLRTGGRTVGEPCSFAYVLDFKNENKRVLHTGDLWIDFSDFPKIAHREYFDVCICEATHYAPETAIPILANGKFGELIFIHIGDKWHNYIDADGREVKGEENLLNICKDLPYTVKVAHDGDVFII